jgi:hypothetical protein
MRNQIHLFNKSGSLPGRRSSQLLISFIYLHSTSSCQNQNDCLILEIGEDPRSIQDIQMK